MAGSVYSPDRQADTFHQEDASRRRCQAGRCAYPTGQHPNMLEASRRRRCHAGRCAYSTGQQLNMPDALIDCHSAKPCPDPVGRGSPEPAPLWLAQYTVPNDKSIPIIKKMLVIKCQQQSPFKTMPPLLQEAYCQAEQEPRAPLPRRGKIPCTGGIPSMYLSPPNP